jgi:single-strand DNA-binding protein
MSAGLNQVTLIGHVASDVELRFTQSETAVTDIRLAVNQRRKQGEKWVDDPVFLTCVLWGKTAETADQYLSKGSLISIQGRLTVDQWEDRDGKKQSTVKVTADRMQMLGAPNGKAKKASEAQQEPVGAGVAGTTPAAADADTTF